MVRELLRRKIIIDKDACSTINRTPLHLAVMRGYQDIMRLLIEAGANKHAKDVDENTPLHMASEYGHAGCIIYLIKECHADPLQKNKYG